MKRLVLAILWLLIPVWACAQAQNGESVWNLYYADVQTVNSDGSVTVTPTVSISGYDGDYCAAVDGYQGYDVLAVMLVGNAWAKSGNLTSGGYQYSLSHTFPNVTIEPGSSADMSYAGKVDGGCFSFPARDGNESGGSPGFYSTPFLEGSGTYFPSPCFLDVDDEPTCGMPWPSISYTNYEKDDLGSQKQAQFIPAFSVAYSSYIPVDHVNGPTSCPYVLDPDGSPYIPLIYMGDANRGPYRTTESIYVTPQTQAYWGFFPDTGYTRNYDALHSPVNGSTLSAADEDGIQYDCYLWNDQGKANPAGFSYDVTFPYPHQGQVHFSGSASNPLELAPAPITWDMRTVVDNSNPGSPTAYVNYNHTCYPAHQVKVNGQIIYLYTPPENDISYIAVCLSGLNKVIGQTNPMSVPPR